MHFSLKKRATPQTKGGNIMASPSFPVDMTKERSFASCFTISSPTEPDHKHAHPLDEEILERNPSKYSCVK